jgi:hypothetical protein
MGHIKEPKGVDFVIASDPLTDQARKEISDFISSYKKDPTKTAKSAGSMKKSTATRSRANA